MNAPDALQAVALGDLAAEFRLQVEDPVGDGVERCIRGEDFEPGQLHFTRWGRVPEDMGPTFTKGFLPGHLLYMTRRAYLRKAAAADFKGVCANTTLVLEANDNLILPELLPHIVHTDRFVDFAVRSSVGSTNPFVKWSDLHEYELRLPPLTLRDSEILQTVTTAEGVIDRARRSEACLIDLIDAFIVKTHAEATEIGNHRKMNEAGDVTMGRQKSARYRQGISPRPFLRVVNVGKLELNLEEIEEMDFSDGEMATYRLLPGDILLTEGDLISPLNVGRPALFAGEVDNCAFQNTLLRFRPGPELDPTFAMLLMEGLRLAGEFARVAAATSVVHLGLKRFLSLTVPVPEREMQLRPSSVLKTLLAFRGQLRSHREQVELVARELRNGILDP